MFASQAFSQGQGKPGTPIRSTKEWQREGHYSCAGSKAEYDLPEDGGIAMAQEQQAAAVTPIDFGGKLDPQISDNSLTYPSMVTWISCISELCM